MRTRLLALLCLLPAAAGCAGTPEPRPAAIDPANPEAPEAPPVEPLEAFRSGPATLDQPLLPAAQEEAPPAGHEGHGAQEEPQPDEHRHETP